MIISRTPFRISFFGGGTDYPDWYLKNGGSVLATSIDKYCYISCRSLPPFFEHRIRAVYSKIENCQTSSEIQHPAIRETMKFMNIHQDLEIHHDGDLPARSGMGTSSSFTVGLLNALYALKREMPSKKKLALESIYIEQKLIRENVGSQDQIITAYGGFRRINFLKSGEIEVNPIIIKEDRIHELESNLLLFYTGIQRTASDIAKNYSKAFNQKNQILLEMHKLVDEGVDVLLSNRAIEDFGKLLHKTWLLKRSINSSISNPIIDKLYAKVLENGAIGGKIAGAGGGGFLLLFVPVLLQKKIRDILGNLILVPFRFENRGSQVIFFDPDSKDYEIEVQDRIDRKIDCFQESQKTASI